MAGEGGSKDLQVGGDGAEVSQVQILQCFKPQREEFRA